MRGKSPEPALHDILDAIAHIGRTMADVALEAFQGDLDRRRIVERNVEIISEASRRLPDDLKARHPEIPWPKVAGIGNILRHDYESVIPDALWKLARDDLSSLEHACKTALTAEQAKAAEASAAVPMESPEAEQT
jgi:uncharacterized protein with HEPN domain